MTNATASNIYSIDTCSMMDWHERYYPVAVFSGLVQKMESLVAAGRVIAPEIVHDEIKSVSKQGLGAWAKRQAGLFVPTATVLSEAQLIQKTYPEFMDTNAEFEEADAYVIALAKLRGGIVVTEETSASLKRNPKRKKYIPDVCADMKIPCINLLRLMHGEQWVF